jgi:large repetitive protein
MAGIGLISVLGFESDGASGSTIAEIAFGPPNTWQPTAPMDVARSGQTATALGNGDVLVAGGGTASAELYEPTTGHFVKTGSMSVSRTDATATMLTNGRVLVAGGYRNPNNGAELSTAELYDPDTGSWNPTGSMTVARAGQTATLLPGGDVLVAGGGCNRGGESCDSGSFLSNLKSAELYDPVTGTWAKTGSMSDRRQFFTATLISDGDVLVSGGFSGCDDDFCSDLSSAELYNPARGTWSVTGSMHAKREQFTATLLSSGEVLAAGGLNEGGFDGNGRTYAEADLYDPTTGSWTETAAMSQPRFGQSATLLNNGWVLVTGGETLASGGTASTEVYEPTARIWVSTGSMSTPRTDLTTTPLSGGDVLATGGMGLDGTAQATAEVYQTGDGPLVSVTPLTLGFGGQQVGTKGSIQKFKVTNNGNGDLDVNGVAVSGTDPGDFPTHTACETTPFPPGGSCSVSVRFAPSFTGYRSASVAVADNAPLNPQGITAFGYGGGPNAWVPTGPLSVGRASDAAVLLRDGRVLVIGGQDRDHLALSSSELFDPATGTFSPSGPLPGPRSYITAVLLQNGDVLAVGGRGPGLTDNAGAEIYDPSSGKWTPTTAMHAPGYGLEATLLSSGDVLVSGLFSGPAEVYDPNGATWTDTGPVVAPGQFDTQTLLQDGSVLAAGGSTTVAALFDPTTNTWAATGSMTSLQANPTATALPDGDVLVAGGQLPNGGVPVATSELYDPTTDIWTLTNGQMDAPRVGGTATLLTNGQVLTTGGCSSSCDTRIVTSTSELYDPSSGYWEPAAPLIQARYGQTATLLTDGDVLVAGGSDYCCHYYSSAEIYTPTELFADPTSGPVGQRVKLAGSGFYARERVDISWDGSHLARTKTDHDGSFAVVIVVPSSTPGTHSISVTGRSSFAGAFLGFRVTASS